MNRTWIWLMSAAVFAVTSAYAQQSTTVDSSSPATQSPAEDATSAAQQAPQAAPKKSADNSSRAADDYRASEQISDDLSVSFPVDI